MLSTLSKADVQIVTLIIAELTFRVFIYFEPRIMRLKCEKKDCKSCAVEHGGILQVVHGMGWCKWVRSCVNAFTSLGSYTHVSVIP